MTRREQSYMTMVNGLAKEFDDDSEIIAKDPKLKAEIAAFEIDRANNEQAANEAFITNTGFSDEKLEAKMAVATEAAILSGRAYVKFSNLKKASIYEQLHTNAYDYSQAPDIECAKIAQNAHDLLLVNIADPTESIITTERLIAFQKMIDHFKDLKGTSNLVHEVSPELTKKFKLSFVPLKTRVKNIKLLMAAYKKTNPDFYNRVKACMKLPVVHIIHTKVMKKNCC